MIDLHKKDMTIVDMCLEKLDEHLKLPWYKFLQPYRQHRFDYYAAVASRICRESIEICSKKLAKF